jgi:hypothetical protein
MGDQNVGNFFRLGACLSEGLLQRPANPSIDQDHALWRFHQQRVHAQRDGIGGRTCCFEYFTSFLWGVSDTEDLAVVRQYELGVVL